MTKMIAALAILAALAWAITAAASWIARKKAPLAIGAGRKSVHASPAEQDKAMIRAQWRTVAAIAFAAVMFTALFRISIGMSGQAGLPITMTAMLSASGGLLLFSALPATKLPRASTPLLPRRMFLPPAAILAAFTAFTLALEMLPGFTAVKHDGVPLLLVAVALAASALLALHRLAVTSVIPDPRMAALDVRWRKLSARNVVHFASGALLASFGASGMLAAVAANDTTAASPYLGTACAAGGAALALAGAVLLLLAAKGALTLRARAPETAAVPVPAA